MKKKPGKFAIFFFAIALLAVGMILSPERTEAASLAKPKLVSVKSVGYKSIQVKWKKVSAASGYYIYRKSGSGAYKKIATVKRSKSSYTDKKAATGTKYTYTVQAYGKSGEKTVKSSYDKKGKSAAALPSQPTLKSAAAKGITKVKLTWSKVTGASGYQLMMKSGGKWKAVATISGGSKTSYTYSKASPGVSTVYSVRAYRKVGKKKYYGLYSKTGLTVKTQVPEPTVKSVTKLSVSSAKVTWTSVSGVGGYKVYRKTGSGKWSELKELTGKSACSYTDSGLNSGSLYSYTVSAWTKLNGKTYYSAYDVAGTSALDTPTLVGAEGVGAGKIQVSWKEVDGADGYRIMRKTTDGDWTVLQDVEGGSVTSSVDQTAAVGTRYTYTVRAYVTSGGTTLFGSYDTTGVSATSSLGTPTLSSVKAIGRKKVKITWSEVSGAGGYRVYYKKQSGSSWLTLNTVSGSASTSIIDKNVTSGKTYSYNVKAYVTSNGDTCWSSYASTNGLSVTIPSGITIDDLEGTADQKVIDAFTTLEFSIVIDSTVTYSGCFSAAKHRITLQTDSESTLLHEVGHFLSFVAGGVASSDDFEDIYDSEKSKYTGLNKVYVTKNAGEYFAESYRDYCEDPSTLKSKRPKTYAAIQDALDLVTDEQVSKIWNLYSAFWK